MCGNSIMKLLNQAALSLTGMTIAGHQTAHKLENIPLCSAKDLLGRKGKFHRSVILVCTVF